MAASNHFKKVSIEPKFLYYKPDGTGRDTYIDKFNGGLFNSDLIKTLSP